MGEQGENALGARRSNCVLRDVLTFLFTKPRTSTNTKRMNQKEPELMEVFAYMGEDLQVVEMELITEEGSVGETEILYHCMSRHGEVTQLCGWEIAFDRKEASNNV